MKSLVELMHQGNILCCLSCLPDLGTVFSIDGFIYKIQTWGLRPERRRIVMVVTAYIPEQGDTVYILDEHKEAA